MKRQGRKMNTVSKHVAECASQQMLYCIYLCSIIHFLENNKKIAGSLSSK